MHIAGMGHRRALHLHGLCAEQIMDAPAHIPAVDELIPRGNDAPVHPHVFQRPGGALKTVAKGCVTGEFHQIHLAHQPHGIPQGRGVAVVLHRAGGNHHVPDGHLLVPRAGHAQVQHPVRMKGKNHALGAQGGVDLSRPAHRQHRLLPEQPSRHKRVHADALFRAALQLSHQALHLHGHRANQSDHAHASFESSECTYYRVFFPCRQPPAHEPSLFTHNTSEGRCVSSCLSACLLCILC